MRFPLRLWLCLLLPFVLLPAAPVAGAQSTQDEVSARLLGKPLYLRGFWSDDKLKFDADGQPEQMYRTISFTVSGVDAKKVEVKGDRLRITGTRMALHFDDPQNPQRLPLLTGDNSHPKPEEITLEVKRGADGSFARPAGRNLCRRPGRSGTVSPRHLAEVRRSPP